MKQFHYVSVFIIISFLFSCSNVDFNSTINISQDAKVTTSISKEFKVADFDTAILNLATKENFSQGIKGQPGSEAKSVQSKPLDILLIVDDSGSMADEQQGLSERLGSLLSKVGHTDWQIAVITTEFNTKTKDRYTVASNLQGPSAPCLVSLIKKTDADYETTFKKLFYKPQSGEEDNPDWIGIAGSDHEQAILKAVYGLSQNIVCPEESDDYKNWLRADSALAIVIVSDEDNCSSYGGTQNCLNSVRTTKAPGSTASYYNQFKDKLYGFKEYVNEPTKVGDQQVYPWGAPIPSSSDLSAWGSGTAEDKAKLKEEQKRIRENSSKFLVNYIEHELGRKMGVDTKVFGLIPGSVSINCPANKAYSYTYQHLICESGGVVGYVDKVKGETEQTLKDRYKTTFEKISRGLLSIVDTFTLDTSEKVDPDLEVYLDGTKLDSGYTLNGNTVSFDEGVLRETNEKVMFNYHYGSTRNNSFTLSSKALADSIIIKVDDVLLDKDQYSYSKNNHSVVFKTYPDENAKIDVDYLKVLVDEGNKGTSGLEVLIGDKLIAGNEQIVLMDTIRINDELVYKVVGEKTEVLNSSGIGILNQDLKSLKFDLSEVMNKDILDLSFSYVKERHKSFIIEELDPNLVYDWSVFVVDGGKSKESLRYKDYTVQGNVVEFKEDLPVEATVIIKARLTQELFER